MSSVCTQNMWYTNEMVRISFLCNLYSFFSLFVMMMNFYLSFSFFFSLCCDQHSLAWPSRFCYNIHCGFPSRFDSLKKTHGFICNVSSPVFLALFIYLIFPSSSRCYGRFRIHPSLNCLLHNIVSSRCVCVY